MAGTFAVFHIDDSGAEKVIGHMLQSITDLKPAMKDFGEHMLNVTDDRFDDETGPDGKKWRELKPATLARKQAKTGADGGTYKKILTEDSDLRDTIIQKPLKRSFRYGSNKKYAAIHQLGGKAGRGHKATIPARPYLGFNNDDIQEFRQIIIDFVTEASG